MIDLFGNEYNENGLITLKSPYQKFKRNNRYRLSNTEKKCKNCKYKYGFEYHNKRYYKCRLMGRSASEATDIRLRNVCDLWQEQTELEKPNA